MDLNNDMETIFFLFFVFYVFGCQENILHLKLQVTPHKYLGCAMENGTILVKVGMPNSNIMATNRHRHLSGMWILWI